MKGTTRSFPLPSEIADVPGTEGWQSMYPYFTRFQPEDDNRFWFYNAMHFPEPMPAFDVITAEIPYTAIGANTTRVFSFPTTLGIEHRIINGRVYITAIPVTDPAEIQRRLADFQRRAGYYYENWDRLQDGWRTRIKGIIREIEAIEVPELPEIEDLDVVMESKGIAQNHYVRENYHRCLDLFSKMWHHHTEFLMLGYGAYVVFFQFCKEAFPEIADQMVARMVAGIDVIMYRPDDELRRLAALAVDAGVDDLFTEGCDPVAILTALRDRGEPGAAWLAAFEQARDPWFNVSTGDGFYHHHRSWNEDLTVPFTALPRYVEQVRGGVLLGRPTQRLRQEREHIVAEYRGLLGTDTERAAFDQMLGLARTVFPYVEDHKFYCEHWFTTRFFQKIRQFGELLARQGVLADAEDVFQLHHNEVDQALADVMLAWASGGKPLGAAHFRPVIAERKRILEVLRDWSPPPALGPVPAALNDPAVTMLWGITAQTLESWSRQAEGAGQDTIPRLRGLTGGGGGSRQGAQGRQPDRPDPRRRDPRLPGDRAELGTGVRQDQGGGLRHRRHDVARRDHRARVRHARRRRHRARDQTDHNRPARARGRRSRHRADTRLSRPPHG